MNIGVLIPVVLGILLILIKWGLIIWGIVWLVRYLRQNREERQRFRLELGKLAEEMHLIREKLESGKD